MRISTEMFKLACRSLLVAVLGLSVTKVAVGETKLIKPETSETKSKSDEAGRFFSDGSEFQVDKFNIAITPPQGWEVVTDNPSLTLILQSPKDEKIVYDKPIYRSNITVAAVHKPSPIDETRAKQLREELISTFGKDPLVKGFQISDRQFFDYKGKKDGLIIYTGFRMDEFEMKQIHVLVSNRKRQFLLTYTDLAERFDQEKLFAHAWASIASFEITGEAPARYADLILYGSVGGFMLTCLLLFLWWRSRNANKRYHLEDDVHSDNHWRTQPPITRSGVWRLDGAELNFDEDDFADDGSFSYKGSSAF